MNPSSYRMLSEGTKLRNDNKPKPSDGTMLNLNAEWCDQAEEWTQKVSSEETKQNDTKTQLQLWVRDYAQSQCSDEIKLKNVSIAKPQRWVMGPCSILIPSDGIILNPNTKWWDQADGLHQGQHQCWVMSKGWRMLPKLNPQCQLMEPCSSPNLSDGTKLNNDAKAQPEW